MNWHPDPAGRAAQWSDPPRIPCPWGLARALALGLAVGLAPDCVCRANPPVDGAGAAPPQTVRRLLKEMDQPNPLERARILQRLQAQAARRQTRAKIGAGAGEGVELLGKTGTDRVLVILVEFAGTNAFTWTPGVSTWDPLGRCDTSEFDGTNVANAAASRFFASKYGIAGPTNFTYAGPRHNELARPTAGTTWMADFAPSYYSNIIFGNGVVLDYTRADGSVLHEDHTGQSVRDYYEDLSQGAYSITGTILGWVQVPNSVWYYGGDGLPGARSSALRPAAQGAIPGGGTARSLVEDALTAAKAAYPDLDWAAFDQNGDGLIDRLWIIHAGLGEEDDLQLLNGTSSGEGGMWSHSSSLAAPYPVVPGVSARSYIMMPENAGIAVLAHEFGHNLGAIDLYTYGEGQTSAGFWTLMADSWVGYPLGFAPQAMDPMHLDQWGWLTPLVVGDPTKVYSVKLGQASRFPAAPGLVRGVKIELPNGRLPMPVQPHGQWQWWGGKQDLAHASLTLRQALHIPAAGATLEFQAAYDTEANYDYFDVEVSTNGGAAWETLRRGTGASTGFPAYQGQSLSLESLASRDILLRFRYTTDEYFTGAGVYVDDIVVRCGAQVLLADDAEAQTGLWAMEAPWVRSNGQSEFTHGYYLQWRNPSASGGYDQGLGDSRYRFGPANTGLLVWHEDDRYTDNSIANYLTDLPSFGPKGKLLVVNAHPQPDLDPYWVARGVANEFGVVSSRGSMRHAPFSRWPTVDFHLGPLSVVAETDFAGRPAVPQFSDALGYYPGLQPLATNLWGTWQWDASVVLPATRPYGVRGPGYAAGTPVQRIVATTAYVGTNNVMQYSTNRLAPGLNLAGGDGNPGSVDGQYGWNVRIVSQTNSWAEVVIWNSRYGHLDDDGDGAPNWQETLAGTDPKNPQSYLRVTGSAAAGPEPGRQLEWPSATNRTYRVLRSTSLQSPFTEVAAQLPATPPVNRFRDPNPGPAPEVFYRLEVE